MPTSRRKIFLVDSEEEEEEEDFSASMDAVSPSTAGESDLEDEHAGVAGTSKSKETDQDVNKLAYRLNQAQVNDLQAKVSALQRQVAEFENKDTPAEKVSKKKMKTSGKSSTAEVDPEADCPQSADPTTIHIRQLGGKFVVMYMFWMGNTQDAFRTKLNPEYEPTDRFKPGLEWKRQGEQADLLEVFPESFHSDFSSDYLPEIFYRGMCNERSNCSSRIRTRVGPTIFDAPPGSFAKPVWRRDQYRTIIGWKQNTDGLYFYAPLAPILYCDYQGKHNNNKIFLNQALFDIFNTIIRGPGALNRPPGVKGDARTNDSIWGLTEITSGAIAASAVLARFALSEDTALQRQGSTTLIDYESDFNTYRKYLIVGLTENRPSVKKIFQKWNNYFFPHTVSEITAGQVPISAVDEAFAALNEDEEEISDYPESELLHIAPMPRPLAATNLDREPSPDEATGEDPERDLEVAQTQTDALATKASRRAQPAPRPRPLRAAANLDRGPSPVQTTGVVSDNSVEAPLPPATHATRLRNARRKPQAIADDSSVAQPVGVRTRTRAASASIVQGSGVSEKAKEKGTAVRSKRGAKVGR